MKAISRFRDVCNQTSDTDILENSNFNLLKFRSYFKQKFTSTFISASAQIKEAMKKQAPVIHLKNDKEKYYDVLTPYSGQVNIAGVEELIARMYGVVGLMNMFPVLYVDESNSVLRAVAPRYESYNETSSQSPYNDLDWHVDCAYRPFTEKTSLSPMPDYLVFGIVHKGHESLPITYIALQDIIHELNEEDIAIGLSPEFSIASPNSFCNRIITKNVPWLIKNKFGAFESRVTFQNSTPLTKRAESLFYKVKKIVMQPSIHNHVNVNAGDIVILNNKSTLHKRDKYKPKWDGKDRYFIRMYSVKSLNHGVLTSMKKPWRWV